MFNTFTAATVAECRQWFQDRGFRYTEDDGYLTTVGGKPVVGRINWNSGAWEAWVIRHSGADARVHD